MVSGAEAQSQTSRAQALQTPSIVNPLNMFYSIARGIFHVSDVFQAYDDRNEQSIQNVYLQAVPGTRHIQYHALSTI